MKKIILSYLDKNYRLTLSSYVSYMLEDKIQKSNVKVKEVLQSIKVIFDIDDDELTTVFDEWADRNQIILNNKVADIRYKLYEKTGVELELTPADINKLIDEEENRFLQGLNNLDNVGRVPIP